LQKKIRKKIGIDIDAKPETVTEENLAPVTQEAENANEVKSEAPAEQKPESTSEKK